MDGATDVGRQFHIIFVLGFAQCVINLLYALVAMCFFVTGGFSLLKMASCLVCISGSITIAWMIYASVVIFSDEGQKCHDTYLEKSGQFIYVWLIIVYVCFGLLCCVSCMMICIITSNQKKRQQQSMTYG